MPKSSLFYVVKIEGVAEQTRYTLSLLLKVASCVPLALRLKGLQIHSLPRKMAAKVIVISYCDIRWREIIFVRARTFVNSRTTDHSECYGCRRFQALMRQPPFPYDRVPND